MFFYTAEARSSGADIRICTGGHGSVDPRSTRLLSHSPRIYFILKHVPLSLSGSVSGAATGFWPGSGVWPDFT